LVAKLQKIIVSLQRKIDFLNETIKKTIFAGLSRSGHPLGLGALDIPQCRCE
jgi:hypothetical protein